MKFVFEKSMIIAMLLVCFIALVLDKATPPEEVRRQEYSESLPCLPFTFDKIVTPSPVDSTSHDRSVSQTDCIINVLTLVILSPRYDLPLTLIGINAPLLIYY